MTIEEASDQTPHLQGACRAGLAAMRTRDKWHIEAEDTRKLTVSIDIDLQLQPQQPIAHRWDYAIGYLHTNRSLECIYWVEIHTSSSKEIAVVIEKLRWLKNWLKSDGNRLDAFERDFIWISSGETSFTLTSPQQKQFALLGLQHKGRILRIPNERTH